MSVNFFHKVHQSVFLINCLLFMVFVQNFYTKFKIYAYLSYLSHHRKGTIAAFFIMLLTFNDSINPLSAAIDCLING